MSAIVVVVVCLAIYFVPTLVASGRHRHVGAIFVLNLFLGWTLLGWVIALVWACMHQPKAPVAVPYYGAPAVVPDMTKWLQRDRDRWFAEHPNAVHRAEAGLAAGYASRANWPQA